jgi:Putative DnaT-like ssDNA binding protein
MALIVETGEIIENSNTYLSLSDCRTLAESRGFSISSDDVILEKNILLAMDFLESKREEFKGIKTNSEQSLQWPRQNVYIDGNIISSNYIPKELKFALCKLTSDINSEVELFPNYEGSFIIEETTGPITTKYSENSNISLEPKLSYIRKIISPLLKSYTIISYRA